MSRTLTAADRSALIRLASTMPAGSEGRRAILAGLVRTSAHEIGYTGQVWTDRVFVPHDIADLPEVVSAAKDFAARAKMQIGVTFRVETGVDQVSVNMEGWPEDVPFGRWVYQWSRAWGIRIDD